MSETPDEPRPPGGDAGDQQDRWPHRRSDPSAPPSSAEGTGPADQAGRPHPPGLPDLPPAAPTPQPPHESPTQQAPGDPPPLDAEVDGGAGPRGWWRGGRLVATAVAAVLLLGGGVALASGGGDGGDDGSDGVATVDGSDGDEAVAVDGDGDGGRVDESELQDAMLEYAECMRDHGIDMPDPEFDGDGAGGSMVIQRGGPGDDGGGPGPESEELQAADEECGEVIEEIRGEMPQLSPEEVAERQDQLVAMAQCMRDRGYDMPDPQVSSDGGVQIQMRDAGPTGVGDPRNDQFPEDQEECSEQAGLENGPMGRRGGSAGGSDGDGSTS